MAGRLRQGAETGYFDIKGEKIHVGEHVKDSAGATWYINSWLQAIPDGEGKAIPLKTLRTTLCELLGREEAAPKVEEKEETPVEEKRGDLSQYTDQEIADELRRRGFTLTAKKEVVTIIEL